MSGSADSYEQVIAEAREERERAEQERQLQEQQARERENACTYTEDETYGEGETVADAEKAALAAYKGGLRRDRMDVYDDGCVRTATFVAASEEAALALGKAKLGLKASILEIISFPPQTRSFQLNARTRGCARRKIRKKLLPAIRSASGKMEIKKITPVYARRGHAAFLPWYQRWKRKTYAIELSGRAKVEIRYRTPARVRIHFS